MLSVAVMAHPARAELVADLIERLDIEEDRVVWDETDTEWHTGVHAWQHHDPDADWHLVIQDDAIVCGNLLTAVEGALAELPCASVASLYTEGRTRQWRQQMRTAEHSGRLWIRRGRLGWGVAIAAPVISIADMLTWTAELDNPYYDGRIAYYYEHLGWPCYCAWPSLVDHRDVLSLMGHRDGRQATRFIGEDASALDWHGRTET